MRLLRRKPATPPLGAHGQRNVDGSYFSIYLCPNGHGQVGSPDRRPDRPCMTCSFDAGIQTVKWYMATRDEAHAFIYKLEGVGMHNGIGFRLL